MQSPLIARTLIDAAPYGVALVDSRGRVISWNPHAERMFGRLSDHVKGRPFAEQLAPPRPDRPSAVERRRLEDVTLWGELEGPVELTGRHASGAEFPIELRVAPVDGEAEGGCLWAVFMADITHLKETEVRLAICREWVQRMGGSIALQSESGEGACFHCRPPFGRASEDAQARGEASCGAIGFGRAPRSPTPAAAPPARSLRVLVVEDTPANQKVVTGILAKRGHQPVLARNGVEALRAFRSGVFDVVLMDVQMPDMDGLRASRLMRESEAGAARSTPIIALTAHAMSDDRQRCLDAGMDDYLAKPLTSQKLVSAIERLGGLAARDAPATCGAESPEGSRPPVDFGAALARFGGDDELFRDAVGYFLEDAPSALDAFRKALPVGDHAEARRAAHSLKGLLANLNATPAANLAAQAERAAEAGDAISAEHVAGELAENLETVIRLAREYLSQ